MKNLRILIGLCLTFMLVPSFSFGQSTNDWQTHQSGAWGDLNTWEQFNGSTWTWPAGALPDSLHTTTIRSGHTITDSVRDTIYVGNSTIEAGGEVIVAGDSSHVLLWIANGTMTVYGTLSQTGIPAVSPGPYAVTIASSGSLVIADGGTFQQDQNGGQIPQSTWNDGSTFLVTGITNSTTVGGNGIQSFYNIVINCPNQTYRWNMGWHPSSSTTTFDTSVTIRGNITVLSTGIDRAYMCGIRVGTSSVPNQTHITINGNINVLNGSIFSSQGTSNGYTNVFITVLGNINVRDSVYLPGLSSWQWSELAISRGSQGNTGTTTWYLKGDTVHYGRKTVNRNSTDTSGTFRGKFIFCKAGTQTVILDDSVAWTGECNMQFGDSVTATTVNIGNSPFGGSGCTQRIKHNAKAIVGPDGYIGGGTSSSGHVSTFAMDDSATLVIASPNGIRATGRGSSGAIRVSGARDYATTANFVYDGTDHQRLGSGFPASANNLTINNAAGVYVDSVTAFTINDTLSVLNGDFELDTCDVTLGPSGSLHETLGNTCVGTVEVTRTVSQSTNESFGGIGLTLNASGAAPGVTTVKRVTGHAQTGGGHNSILRYFDISPVTNAGLNATLDYFYDNSELNGQDADALGLWESGDSGSTWRAVPSTVDTGLHRVRVTAMDSLYRFTASDVANPIGSIYSSFHYDTRWNMISLPLVMDDSRKSTLFPTPSVSVSAAYEYAHGYSTVSVLVPGHGYWLKFNGAHDVHFFGTTITLDTINLSRGWNMIGSLSDSVRIGTPQVQEDPPGILSGSFYGYSGGYKTTTTIAPGKAYWVKSTVSDSKLILNSSLGAVARQAVSADPLHDFSSLTITDAAGNTQTLYLGEERVGFTVSKYEMPPVPQAGVFDVRFASQRFVETYGSSGGNQGVTFPLALQSVEYPLTISWHVTENMKVLSLTDEGSGLQKRLVGEGTMKLAKKAETLTLNVSESVAAPRVFSLVQNYPNPFNPETNIRFSVENTDHTTLTVYDMLGQRVSILFDGVAEAGRYYEMKFNAANLSSGVYYYRLQSGSQSDLKKLLLLK